MRKFLPILVCLLLLFSISGCNKRDNLEPLGKCPVELQLVTAKDSYKDLSYSFLAPTNWLVVSPSAYLVRSYSAKAITKNQYNYPFIEVRNFEKANSLIPKDERMKMYKDLFNNKYDDYIKIVKKELSVTNTEPSDMKFKLYKGAHGKIVTIQYKFPDLDRKTVFLVVDCYREDIPYNVYGSADIQSKDFDPIKTIPWIMDSLTVK